MNPPPANSPVFSLPQATAIYAGQVKFMSSLWNWLQAAALASAGAAYAVGDTHGRDVAIALLVGFIAYASINLALMLRAKYVTFRTAKAIQAYLSESPDRVDKAFREVATMFGVAHPVWAALLHLGIDGAVVWIILRFMF
jgi:hypothetical protein